MVDASLEVSTFSPLVRYSGLVDVLGIPLEGYFSNFFSSFREGFAQRLSWMMMEFCEELLIPSRLSVHSLGLLNALHVLSVFLEVIISGSMVAGNFEVRKVVHRLNKFELVMRCDCRYPIDFPFDAVVGIDDTSHFFFVQHFGPSRIPWLWLISGDSSLCCHRLF